MRTPVCSWNPQNDNKIGDWLWITVLPVLLTKHSHCPRYFLDRLHVISYSDLHRGRNSSDLVNPSQIAMQLPSSFLVDNVSKEVICYNGYNNRKLIQ